MIRSQRSRGMPVASVTRMRGVSRPHDASKVPEPSHVRRVRQDAAGIVLETLPLRQEVVAAVVADLVEQLAVDVADLGDVRRVDHDLAAVGHRRLDLVHALRGGPQVVVHRAA